ncbi:cell division cycle-associated protein 7-like isoform X2 [Ananas comosus]|uniref:Cell division cycle-associated protein 7-like isoform X2 n=1 Tax=Ananas comosus TaxID=4615 RepID=A0A6P5G4K5_ANACO|nr:cell division cycle-associated protein 7-like isoform X2 [Ananas comosus]
MGKLDAKCDYESLRNARISDNKARMQSLGIRRCAGELNLITSPSRSRKDYTNTPERTKKARKIEATPLRRSDRVKKPSDVEANSAPPLRRSDRLKGKSPDPVELTPQGGREVVVSEVERRQLLSRRCDSKGRGSVYDPVLGICCHFCRQKKLCGEEDCRRCGDRDSDQPCIDMEEVRMKKDWTCPHCIEEKGLNKFWICNSSLCLKKRKMAPTGIAIYQAREQGYKSVAHLLMAKLKENALQ